MRILLDLQGCQAPGSRNRGIGRYSMALAKGLVRQGSQHEFWILLNAAFPETIAPLHAEFEGLLPASRFVTFQPLGETAEVVHADHWRTKASEAIRRHAIRELRPDIVHVSSLFEGIVDDCATSMDPEADGVPAAVTVYDLIPLLNAKRYLPDATTEGWYMRKIESLRRADLLLGISESASEEARSALTGRRGEVVTISSAADPAHFHPAPANGAAARLGLKRDFVMYTGGIDWRKNIEGLLRAYALLPREVRAAHQLALVCHAEPYAKTQLLATAAKLGLAEDDLVLTGYVSDADLADLYRSCSLFVFPSLHEGFGLPALEAMMCGAVVIGSNATSIPEVIGREDALFDPKSDRAIADLMLRALDDEAFRASLRADAPVQAARFSWEITAGRALEAMKGLHARKQRASVALRKPRLAMHAPLPPAQSGVADYTGELLEVLREHYEIELVSDQSEVSLPGELARLPVRTTAWFREHAKEYDRIVYQFGNSMFHAHMFELLARFPGVVVLHDFFISGVLNWMDSLGHEPDIFGRALFNSHGPRAAEEEREHGRLHALLKYPCNRPVVQRATGVIVHSRYAIEAAQRFYGAGYSRDWALIPHLRVMPAGADRDRARAGLGAGPDDFLVCSFGHIGPTKQNLRAVQAWNASTLAHDPRCRLVLVGNAAPPYGDELREAIANGPAPDRVTITGFADRALYERYLRGADLALQLRTLSRGETSGAVLDCLANGLPLIANANGSNAEYPPHVLRLLPDEFADDELVGALETLRTDVAERRRLAEAGPAWVRSRHDPRRVAARYRDAIEGFAARPRNVSYWQAIEEIAALGAPPSEGDLTEAATALSATATAMAATLAATPAEPGGGRAGGTTAPSGAP